MLNNKVILIIIDGCRYDVAMKQMGYLNSMVECGEAQVRKMISEIPSNSRPLYEVIMTGQPTNKNEIYTNFCVQKSKETSIFDLVKKEGGVTGVAGYYWMSELYNQAPYNMLTDRIQNDLSKSIQHGIFYSEDNYPDSHVFADANSIITEYSPDFMVVHSMNVDDIGHKYTAESKEYMRQVNIVDQIIGTIVPKWRKLGYQIIVTADHGMDEYGLHGGSLPQHREVPLYLVTNGIELPKEKEIPQLKLINIMMTTMGIG